MRVDLREFSSELYQIASGCVRKEYVGQMVVIMLDCPRTPTPCCICTPDSYCRMHEAERPDEDATAWQRSRPWAHREIRINCRHELAGFEE